MSTIFIRRLTAPSNSNLYYIKTTKGGYNKCIQIKPNGSVLPNCTGYAWGRYCEEQNIHDCKLSRGDAGNWYYKNDGYARGRLPKLGAVICWSKDGGAGHVAIVEEIYSNGKILTSNSAYHGSRFFKETLRPPNYSRGPRYHFQGFIYPDTEFIDPDTPIPAFVPAEHKFKWVLYAKKFRNRNSIM